MVEGFDMGPRHAGFVLGQYLIQGIMQNNDKNWVKSLSSSECIMYTSCYPSSISIILLLEALLKDLHSRTLSSTLGAALLFVTLVPGFVCWNNKTQESGLAVGPASDKATALGLLASHRQQILQVPLY